MTNLGRDLIRWLGCDKFLQFRVCEIIREYSTLPFHFATEVYAF